MQRVLDKTSQLHLSIAGVKHGQGSQGQGQLLQRESVTGEPAVQVEPLPAYARGEAAK